MWLRSREKDPRSDDGRGRENGNYAKNIAKTPGIEGMAIAQPLTTK
jgi:hypothetical protein